MKIITIFSALFLFQLAYAQSSYKVATQPTLESRWEYVEGEKGSYTERKAIRNLLAAEMKGFENPHCLRDTLLNNSTVQANVALGAIIQEVRFESIVELRGKGVIFQTIWDNGISGWQPFAFCKMKETFGASGQNTTTELEANEVVVSSSKSPPMVTKFNGVGLNSSQIRILEIISENPNLFQNYDFYENIQQDDGSFQVGQSRLKTNFVVETEWDPVRETRYVPFLCLDNKDLHEGAFATHCLALKIDHDGSKAQLFFIQENGGLLILHHELAGRILFQ